MYCVMNANELPFTAKLSLKSDKGLVDNVSKSGVLSSSLRQLSFTSLACNHHHHSRIHCRLLVKHHYYEGRPINKLQNGIILLIFKI